MSPSENRNAPGFEDSLVTRVVFGEHAVHKLGTLSAELGAKRVLLVTDAGLVRSGHVRDAESSLDEAGIAVEPFADVSENPSTDDVERCCTAAKVFQPDLLVGFGGGSPIDVAKGANFLYSCGGRMQDYWGVDKATADLLPLIAVPTTAGTGTEVQSFALIADAETHQKMACGDRRAAPRVALLDPTLTVSMPRHVTACTGLDAIGHAVEAAVSTRRNPRSARFAKRAFTLAAPHFERVLEDPHDLEARGAMLQAAAQAGLAIEHAMLGAAHALANPLTARFGVPHGQAVAMALPHVVRFNGEGPQARTTYAELARDGLHLTGDAHTLTGKLADRLADALSVATLPASIADCGVVEADLPELSQEAARQWTASFNPRPVGEPELIELYYRMLGPASASPAS